MGQHHTLVPEFRISEVFDEYVTKHNSNFLTRLSGTFSITGSALSSSTQENFFKVFSTTDFLKHFTAVDNKLNQQTNGLAQTIRRGSINLQCAALMQFLPYKGFYPAERAVELGAIFSRSFAPVMEIPQNRSGAPKINGYNHALWRIPMEPFFAPGILFNTIKSGIAVGNYLVRNTGAFDLDHSRPAPSRTVMGATASIDYRENNLNSTSTGYNIPASNMVGLVLQPSGGQNTLCSSSRGYYMEPMPFDSIRFPEKYLAANYKQIEAGGAAQQSSLESGWIYDSNAGSASLPNAFGVASPLQAFGTDLSWRLAGAPDIRYGSAIDNFCCNVIDFFQKPLKTFVSRDETDFNIVKRGQYYAMDILLGKSPTADITGALAPETFGMYNRASASDNGRPTLDQIFANSTIDYFRPMESQVALKPAGNFSLFSLQQITASVNIFQRLQFVPNNTTSRSSRWSIQSYFETPVLNFYNVDVVTSRTGSGQGAPTGSTGKPEAPEIRGMWHQKGNKLNSREGIYLGVVDSPTYVTASSLGATPVRVSSLRNIVGFGSIDKRIGDFAETKTISEAVVVIPFKTIENQRTFFNITAGSKQYHEQKRLLQKYIFPPTFDYLINPSVKPLAMYAFEFSKTLDQDDLINIWQNLPPKFNNSFERTGATIEIKELVDELLGQEGNLQWLVFKVKMRGRMDYNIFKEQQALTSAGINAKPITEPVLNLPYSYNWPYDFFSMVELVRIGQQNTYVTEDILEREREEEGHAPGTSPPGSPPPAEDLDLG